MKWERNDRPERLPHEPLWYLHHDDTIVAWVTLDRRGYWWARFDGLKSQGPFETEDAAKVAAMMLFGAP